MMDIIQEIYSLSTRSRTIAEIRRRDACKHSSENRVVEMLQFYALKKNAYAQASSGRMITHSARMSMDSFSLKTLQAVGSS